jgi:NAD(P)-dependent dehydrogenase (short-subunit alcohol dehydrogenase family)
VNLFLPGGGATGLLVNIPKDFFKGERPKNALGRGCTPDDVGQIVAFMVSDKNSYMVGQLVQTNI